VNKYQDSSPVSEMESRASQLYDGIEARDTACLRHPSPEQPVPNAGIERRRCVTMEEGDRQPMV
jgi:hypothetical protein